AGGGEAAVNVFSYENNNEWKTPPMVSKMVGIKLKKGERVRLQTPGGGGYGAPADRLQSSRERDLALGYVTAGAAKKEGV
ncbi:MAG: hydantoinase B/oxoprolinase family protein, partial [Polaromonas sp.]